MALDKITYFYLKKYPEEAAITLNHASTLDIANVLSNLTPLERGEILAYLMNDIVLEYLKSQSDDDIKKILTAVPLKVAVRIVLQLTYEERGRCLNLLPINVRAKIKVLMDFGLDSVASKIDTDMFAFDQNISVKSAIEGLKRFEQKLLHSIYVVDGQFKLVGYVDVRKLLLAERDKTLGEIMERDIVFLPATTKLSKAHMHPAWQRLNHLPVVNRSGQFLGVLSQRQLPMTTTTQAPWVTIAIDSFVISTSGFMSTLANTIENFLGPNKGKL